MKNTIFKSLHRKCRTAEVNLDESYTEMAASGETRCHTGRRLRRRDIVQY